MTIKRPKSSKILVWKITLSTIIIIHFEIPTSFYLKTSIFFRFWQRFIFHLYFIHKYITCIFVFRILFHVWFDLRLKSITLMNNNFKKINTYKQLHNAIYLVNNKIHIFSKLSKKVMGFTRWKKYGVYKVEKIWGL